MRLNASPSIAGSGRRAITGAAIVIVAGIVVAYANSFAGAFVLDDHDSITANPTIRRLALAALAPPHGQGLTVEGRPFLNLSLAFNYALSGTHGWSYHAVNVVIHALAALLLFGLVRRTLVALSFPHSTQISASAALLWAVHPLQTEAVTYIVQRAESLMGLLFLLTLYCFARGAATGNHRGWFTLAVIACALGMATKEVMVSAPLLAFLYDRTFVAGSFRDAWRRRWPVHLSLAATWLLLAWLVAGAGDRGGTIGAKAGLASWQYALCQSRAIVHYLRLSLWPTPLIFDYGSDFVPWRAAAPYALLDAALLALTVFALWRRPALGFCGAWFFGILAPSSSIVGGTRQMLAEHRTYLPLAAVAVLVVLGVAVCLGRRGRAVWLPVSLALIVATLLRNADYRTEISLFSDVLAKRPGNFYAHNVLGAALARSDRDGEAIVHYEAAVRLAPGFADAHNNLANALARRPGRHAEALAHFATALQLQPDFAEAHNNLAALLARIPGRRADALAHYETALRLKPGLVEAHLNLAGLLASEPAQLADAISHYEAALRSLPDHAEAHRHLADLLARLPGRRPDAMAHYETALRLKPDFAEAHNNLGGLLALAPPRWADALAHYEAALRLKPDYAEAHINLALLLAEQPGRQREAIAHYETAVRLVPDSPQAHNNLALLLASQPDRQAEALSHFETALRLQPESAAIHFNLARELARLPDRQDDAARHYAAALRIDPNLSAAKAGLERLLLRAQ